MGGALAQSSARDGVGYKARIAAQKSGVAWRVCCMSFIVCITFSLYGFCFPTKQRPSDCEGQTCELYQEMRKLPPKPVIFPARGEKFPGSGPPSRSNHPSGREHSPPDQSSPFFDRHGSYKPSLV